MEKKTIKLTIISICLLLIVGGLILVVQYGPRNNYDYVAINQGSDQYGPDLRQYQISSYRCKNDSYVINILDGPQIVVSKEVCILSETPIVDSDGELYDTRDFAD